jgi:RimJ/RimL family protein N-acetyltransferase
MTKITLPEKLITDRLILRRWREADLEPFAALNMDSAVMQHFPNTLDRCQSAAMIERIEKSFNEESLGLWAVEERESGNFIGFVGLSKPKFEAHFTPCVEVGWRLAKQFWGKGYAPEAAQAATKDGFERLCLVEIVSFTSKLNVRSIKVMEKLKMVRKEADDFMHPVLPVDHPLSWHVLYRLHCLKQIFSFGNKLGLEVIDKSLRNLKPGLSLLVTRSKVSISQKFKHYRGP